MFHDRTADVTYGADVTLFLHATGGLLSLTAADFHCFKCYLVSFSRCKLRFHPILYLQNTLNEAKLMRNGEKKVNFLK